MVLAISAMAASRSASLAPSAPRASSASGKTFQTSRMPPNITAAITIALNSSRSTRMSLSSLDLDDGSHAEQGLRRRSPGRVVDGKLKQLRQEREILGRKHALPRAGGL